MAKTRNLRNTNKPLFSRFFSGIGSFFKMLGRGFLRVIRICDSKLTIMVVPHSQGKVVNFHTNVFALALGIILILGVITSFVYVYQDASAITSENAKLKAEHSETLASLDEHRDEFNNLLQTAKRFKTSLSQTLSILGINSSVTVSKASMNDSDLSSLYDNEQNVTGSTKEVNDIRQFNSYLESAVQPIEEIGKMLESQETLFTDIPNIWPVKGGIGHISMPFGQTPHPITGQWYIHKGLDISTWRSGDPIVATANGQVVTVAFDPGFGNYVIIKHKHGIYTRYCHMNSVRAKKGQFVSQRDVIGTIGSTGIVTGPHLHYEIHIGSDVVDPSKYVNVKLTK